MRTAKPRQKPSFDYPSEIESFVAALDAMCTTELTQFLSLSPDFDSLLVNDGAWRSLMNNALDSVIDGKSAPEIQASRLILLAGAGQFTMTTGPLEIGVQTLSIPENSSFLANAGCHLMVGFLSDKPVRTLHYRMPAGSSFDIFDPNIELEIINDFMLEPRTRFTVCGKTEVAEFKVTDESCALIAGSAWVTSQIWSFSQDDLRPRGASMTSLSSSILIAMLAEIARADFSDAADAVKALYGHPDHNVRWAAVRCLGALGSQAAHDLLHEAVNDPHPHIRRAAARSAA